MTDERCREIADIPLGDIRWGDVRRHETRDLAAEVIRLRTARVELEKLAGEAINTAAQFLYNPPSHQGGPEYLVALSTRLAALTKEEGQ